MRDAAGGWVPDVGLTKWESFDFFHCFLPLISGYSTLTFHPGTMLTLREAAGWWVPNVSLTIQETLWYLDYFLPVILHLPDFIFDPVRQTTPLTDGSPRSASQYKKTCTKKNAWTKIRTQDLYIWNLTAAVPCHCTNFITLYKCNQLYSNILSSSDPIF